MDGLTHYVVGETATGHPYRGFLSVQKCANVTLRNCFATGHKVYTTIGSAGESVSMGSYDFNANGVVNFSMIHCRMNHILDRTRWGVIGTNFCKNILLEDCTLSRMDAHMGVSGTYIVRSSTLGYMGLNAIGRGKILIEDSTIYGSSLINFRSDYGSTWEGKGEIHNSRWLPPGKSSGDLYMFQVSNDGTHDFGYPCFMPEEITIEGLEVELNDHQGELYYFSNPGDENTDQAPYPYQLIEFLSVKQLSISSGAEINISPNAFVKESVVLGEKPGK